MEDKIFELSKLSIEELAVYLDRSYQELMRVSENLRMIRLELANRQEKKDDKVTA